MSEEKSSKSRIAEIRKQALGEIKTASGKSPAFTMHKWTSRTKSRHAVSVLFIHNKKIVNLSQEIAFVCGLRYSKRKEAVLVWGACEDPGEFLMEQFNKFAKTKIKQESI